MVSVLFLALPLTINCTCSFCGRQDSERLSATLLLSAKVPGPDGVPWVQQCITRRLSDMFPWVMRWTIWSSSPQESMYVSDSLWKLSLFPPCHPPKICIKIRCIKDSILTQHFNREIMTKIIAVPCRMEIRWISIIYMAVEISIIIRDTQPKLCVLYLPESTLVI